jgi:hypothetical protein
MSSSHPSCSGANNPAPRMGIFVDCQQFRAKVRPPAPPVMQQPSAAVVPTVLRAPRAAPLWRSPRIVVPAVAMLLLVVNSLAVAGSYALLAPAEDQSAYVAVSAPSTQKGPPITPKKASVPAKTVAKASGQTVAKKEPAPAVPPAPKAEAKNTAEVEPPVPAKVELVKADEAQPLAKEPLLQQDVDNCAGGQCKSSDDSFGTAVTWVASPEIAKEQAVKQHKLLFVLHVSGNFEDPGFT